ncbi:MAG: DUF2292 domain-containing protein [Bacillota bacterium]|nr:DUF2292 domain-containing protein [Bacillota bacterium]
MDEKKENIVLTKEELKVIELMRSIPFGELRVIINNSKAVRVEEIRKSIQL